MKLKVNIEELTVDDMRRIVDLANRKILIDVVDGDDAHRKRLSSIKKKWWKKQKKKVSKGYLTKEIKEYIVKRKQDRVTYGRLKEILKNKYGLSLTKPRIKKIYFKHRK
jgi:hypothetical protein